MMRKTLTYGFSLVELLIVVAIIAIITAIAIPNISNALHKSKRSRAMAELKGFVTAFSAARSGSKSGPALNEGENIPVSTILTPEVFSGNTKDPWGGDYLYTYRATPQEFILFSWGKDRQPGASSGEFDSDIIFKNMQFVAPAAAAGQ